MTRRPHVVLVDAFSTGAMLAELWARTHACLHVQSFAAMPPEFVHSLRRELFAGHIQFTGDLDPIAARLRAWEPVAVVAASEFGVPLADRLCEALGLPGNGSALSAARRDKFLMAQRAAAAGLRIARQFKASDPDALIEWYERTGRGKVVVKPLDSAGSDNVHICENTEQVRHAFLRIKGKVNLMLARNDEVMIQTYLEGDEFVVNSVSLEGRHFVCDVWRSRKTFTGDGRKIYDYEDLEDPDSPVIARISGYAGAVLDALGIRYGPAHSELVLTSDGPVLLETGARLSGLANPAALERCTGVDQVVLSKEIHCDPERFRRRLESPYRRRAHARCINLIARRERPLRTAELQACLRGLASFDSMRLRLGDGAPVRPTVDLNTSPGVVFLVHEDKARLEADYGRLRAWEREAL